MMPPPELPLHRMSKEDVGEAIDFLRVVAVYTPHLDKHAFSMGWCFCQFSYENLSLLIEAEDEELTCMSRGVRGDIFDFVERYERCDPGFAVELAYTAGRIPAPCIPVQRPSS